MNAADTLVQPKALVVDDSRMVRASISKHLRSHFAIREENDGEAGWQTLLVDPDIQVVLTDIGMPHLDGYGLLARIRASKVPRVRNMPVIIVSGDDDEEAKQKALKLGANDFIVKGISCADLLQRLALLHLANITDETIKKSLENPFVSEPEPTPSVIKTKPPQAAFNTETMLGGQSEWRNLQELAFTTLLQTDLSRTMMSAIVVEIDHFERLVEWHGNQVVHLIARKLVKVIAGKIRKEDSVTQLGPSQLGILFPRLNAEDCLSLAETLQKTIEKVIMSYRGERIQISVALGVANSAIDGGKHANHLIEIAAGRARAGRASGGNQVVNHDQRSIEKTDRGLTPYQTVSLDLTLLQLRSGARKKILPHLPEIISSALPLLEFIEENLRCELPIHSLKQYVINKQKNIHR